MTAAAPVEVPHDVLDDLWALHAHQPCRISFNGRREHCPDPAVVLIHCRCSHCGYFTRLICDWHSELLQAYLSMDIPAQHLIDRGVVDVQRFTAL